MTATAPRRRRIDAGPIGNALVLVALIAVAVLATRWQVEPMQWRDPGPGRWWFAGIVSGLWAGFTGAIVLTRRLRQSADAAATAGMVDGPVDWLVAHASQTGYAEQLARLSVEALQAAGQRVRLVPLGRLDAETLAATSQALFIVSTTGEGDPPDPALPFVRRTLDREAALGSLRYGLLALGDREYDAYCAFGHRLDGWLRHSHAHPLFDMIEVDNGDAGALRLWQQHLGQLTGRTDLPDWSRPAYQRWRLRARRHLNPGSLGGPAFEIRLQPDDPALLDWSAGDIAEIGPCHADADIDAWLAMSGVDGDTATEVDATTLSLRERLAGSQLPAPADVEGLDAQRVAEGLQPLPHREYSIASTPGEGHLRLLVRQMRHPDGRLGSGSGWLSEHARIGDPIALRIRSNRAFHLHDDDRPLILIGNGTGLAGLRALLQARIERGHARNWLLFGERQRRHDLHFGDELRQWQAQGWLDHLDLAFSRDGTAVSGQAHGPGRYVQDRLREQRERLGEWIAAGAAIHVCGSLQGMAPGVDAVLRDCLGDEAVDQLIETGRYRRDVY
ncbi:sulfite reductase subunit alpha [Marilutibacter maris]|uniref:NADPH--hemoprotein reductase n=1 Tax=Marilutibacter maris TaxID=1605891 RepID=A0A2U9T5V6_9GAMM|nr:sulfite reductase flavoprotein subunit alpha [Lysobacter maris]AWV06587.1 hypothetical protein C9I47_0866 [Lysobacter maris]